MFYTSKVVGNGISEPSTVGFFVWGFINHHWLEDNFPIGFW